MKRLHLTFSCSNNTLAGTLDTAPSSTGLLVVSGGNEIRSGTFSGQALLAGRIAKAGFPVFRFDRRGIGDSGGENRGFRKSRNDIAAALAAFSAMAPQVTRVIGFGNCDAASALMLTGGAGCDGLVLSNPWVEEGDIDAGERPMPPKAIRSRYLEKLQNPKEIKRLLTGDVNLGKLFKGLGAAARPVAGGTSLATEMAAGLRSFTGPARILLAMKDRTAQNFESAWSQVGGLAGNGAENRADVEIARCEGAGHSYSEAAAREWLYQQLLIALRNCAP